MCASNSQSWSGSSGNEGSILGGAEWVVRQTLVLCCPLPCGFRLIPASDMGVQTCGEHNEGCFMDANCVSNQNSPGDLGSLNQGVWELLTSLYGR